MIIPYCWLFVKIKLNNSKKKNIFLPLFWSLYILTMGMPGRCMLPQTLRKTKTDNNEISAKKEGEERRPQKRKPQKRRPQKRKPQKRKPQKRRPRPGCCAGARFFFLSAAGGGLRRGAAAQGCELACGTGLHRGAAARRCARPYRACSISEGYIVPSFITKEHSESASSSWSRSRCQPARSASLPG